MSWGKGISIFIILFIITILGMVWLSMQQNVEMIDTNYYQKEIEYQNVIDGKNRLKAQLKGAVFYQDQNNKHVLFLNNAYYEPKDTIFVELLKLDQAKSDFNFTINQIKDSMFEINTSTLKKGMYRMRASWKHKNLPYYFEQDVFIRK